MCPMCAYQRFLSKWVIGKRVPHFSHVKVQPGMKLFLQNTACGLRSAGSDGRKPSRGLENLFTFLFSVQSFKVLHSKHVSGKCSSEPFLYINMYKCACECRTWKDEKFSGECNKLDSELRCGPMGRSVWFIAGDSKNHQSLVHETIWYKCASSVSIRHQKDAFQVLF